MLILTIYPEDQFGSRVLKSGAAGYVNKAGACDDLIVAIRKICSGRKYISSELAEKLASDLAANNTTLPSHEKLSDREYQVMRMIASGKTVGEIARELCLSEKTISTYRARILEKMAMKTNAQLTYYAMHKKLVDLG